MPMLGCRQALKTPLAMARAVLPSNWGAKRTSIVIRHPCMAAAPALMPSESSATASVVFSVLGLSKKEPMVVQFLCAGGARRKSRVNKQRPQQNNLELCGCQSKELDEMAA